MRINHDYNFRAVPLILLMLVIITTSTRLKADTGICGGALTTLPFTDVASSNTFFCAIGEAYFSGLTNGTSATTYSPAQNVPREQMAAFVTRTLDQSLKRGSRRAALNQFWTTIPHFDINLGYTYLGGEDPRLVQSDGTDLWVSSPSASDVLRVRASDGIVVDRWHGASYACGVLVAMSRVFVTGRSSPGSLYMIDPSQPSRTVTTVTSSLFPFPEAIAFDGNRIWTANAGDGSPLSGSVSIVTPTATLPWSVGTAISPSFRTPAGILYDGANIWVTDAGAGMLYKLDSEGNIIQTVTVGNTPKLPIFDGTNIWIPNFDSNTVTVVRASTGSVLATLSGNGLNRPNTAAFDGERILVTNWVTPNSVSLWKAADLTPLGTFPTVDSDLPSGSCSDGLNFWIALSGRTNMVARF